MRQPGAPAVNYRQGAGRGQRGQRPAAAHLVGHPLGVFIFLIIELVDVGGGQQGPLLSGDRSDHRRRQLLDLLDLGR